MSIITNITATELFWMAFIRLNPRAWVWQEWKAEVERGDMQAPENETFQLWHQLVFKFFSQIYHSSFHLVTGEKIPKDALWGFAHCCNWTSCRAGLIDSFIAGPWLEDEIFTLLYSSSQAVDFWSCNINLASCAVRCWKRKSKAKEWLVKIASSLISFPRDMEESCLCSLSQKSIDPRGVGLCIL